MKLHQFTEYFQTEEQCKAHFKRVREQLGVHCKGCGSKIIIGWLRNGNGNVRNVVFEQL